MYNFLVTYYAAVLLVAVIVLKGPTWALYTDAICAWQIYESSLFYWLYSWMLQWKAANSMQSWDSPFGASSGKFKIGTKPLAVGQKLRICGKPWWQAKGHWMPSTLLIFLSLRLCIFWKLDLNSAEELHLQSRPRVPLAHRFTLRAINLVPPCPTLWPHPNHSQQRYLLTCIMQKLRSFIHYPALPWQTLWPRPVSQRFST
jgi:hypothetical protein